MIFLNRGEDYTKHEQITADEAQTRYPSLDPEIPRPYNEQGKRLRSMREKARITMRELSRRSAQVREELGAPLAVSEICDIENGRSTLCDIDIEKLWEKLINGQNTDRSL